MTGNPLYFPVFRAFDSSGNPLAGGKLYSYEAGSSTPKATYTNSGLGTPNTNPVILDAYGSAPIWLSGTYKFDLYDANDVQQNDFPIDNVTNDSGATGPAGTFQIVTAGGTVDAITADYSPNITLANLTTCAFVATGANLTTTPTFAPDGLTAHTITKKGGVALVPGDIPAALAVCILEYNSANTRWELLNPASTAMPWVVATGTADALTATYSPAIPAVYDGLILSFRAVAANATTTPTFSPNSLTARTITKKGGTALVAGDIAGNLAEYWVRYNSANTRWELLNPTGTSGITDLSTVTPDNTADYVAFYDVSGSVYGKCLMSAMFTNTMVKLSTQTASNSATVDFTALLSNTYSSYRIECIDVVPASAVELLCRYKDAGGAISTNTYDYSSTGRDSAGNAVVNDGTGQSSIKLSCGINMDNTSTDGAHFEIRINNPSHSKKTRISFNGQFKTTALSRENQIYGGGVNSGTGAMTGFQFLMSSGNITSGTFILYGIL